MLAGGESDDFVAGVSGKAFVAGARADYEASALLSSTATLQGDEVPHGHLHHNCCSRSIACFAFGKRKHSKSRSSGAKFHPGLEVWGGGFI